MIASRAGADTARQIERRAMGDSSRPRLVPGPIAAPRSILTGQSPNSRCANRAIERGFQAHRIRPIESTTERLCGETEGASTSAVPELCAAGVARKRGELAAAEPDAASSHPAGSPRRPALPPRHRLPADPGRWPAPPRPRPRKSPHAQQGAVDANGSTSSGRSTTRRRPRSHGRDDLGVLRCLPHQCDILRDGRSTCRDCLAGRIGMLRPPASISTSRCHRLLLALSVRGRRTRIQPAAMLRLDLRAPEWTSCSRLRPPRRALEINSQPNVSTWTTPCRRARERGGEDRCRHRGASPAGARQFRWGVTVARRAGWSRANILTPHFDLRVSLRRHRAAGAARVPCASA